MKKALIIEDEAAFCFMLKTWFEKNKFETDAVLSGKEAVKLINTTTYDIVLSDLRLPDNDGISLLQLIKQTNPATVVFIMTGYADIQTAVSAIKFGAYDYLEKPVNPDILRQKIAEAFATKEERKPTNVSKSTNGYQIPFIVGESEASKKLNEHIKLVAPTSMSVLITGESGTGKEYAARYLHENSNRKNGPFVALDCGAITKELGASELFGHVKGSFTSAIDNKKGTFEYADGGTLFLDEIGNLSYGVQIQLLRALQERIIKPVGGNKEISVDVRVITATNENLLDAIAAGRFREDLYHRINEFSMRMPSLRERGSDLLLFANVFLENANNELVKNIKGFNEKAREIMNNYAWSGNLRELRNVVKRAVLFCSSDEIDAKDFPIELTEQRATSQEDAVQPLKRQNEREMIIEALERNGNNKSKAAKALGVDRKTLYNKLHKYGLLLNPDDTE